MKEIRKMASELKPEFNLGKNGITSTFIDTVFKFLKAHEIVKIKVLTATSKDEIEYYSSEIAKETDSIIVNKIGYTFTLYRKKE